MLARFWLQRCGRVLLMVAVALATLQWVRGGAVDVFDTLFWSALPAVLSASINTWWAARHGCGLRRSDGTAKTRE